MDFNELNATIPRATGEKLHVMTMKPYTNITLAMPGRHQKDTDPIGGDFVVMVDDTNLGWVQHQFTHGDLWDDLEKKMAADSYAATDLMKDYAGVVRGFAPGSGWTLRGSGVWKNTLDPQTFLYAVQCLAVAEHRRYWPHEKDGGGRYLPARFSAGIIEGKWSAADAKQYQYRGRQGLENLIKLKGRPKPLKEIAGK